MFRLFFAINVCNPNYRFVNVNPLLGYITFINYSSIGFILGTSAFITTQAIT